LLWLYFLTESENIPMIEQRQ